MSLAVPATPNALLPGPTNGAAEEPYRSPAAGMDPIATQALLCRELSRLAAPQQSGDAALHAVLVLDPHAQDVGKRLLTAYAEGSADLRAFDSRYLISARLLSRSFAQAYERLLAHLREPAGNSWRRNVVTVLVRLFRHRQSELLLRLMRYKRDSSEQWRQLYAAYRFAQTNALENHPLASADDRDAADERSVHHHFIELLLVGAMNTGQLSPRELLWASQWLVDWSTLLALQPMDVAHTMGRGDTGFVVDLAGNEGLVRVEPGKAGEVHLDTTDLVTRIDDEIAALNASREDETVESTTGHDASIALLSKLRILFSPHPVQFARRGERKFIAAAVQSLCGLGHVVRTVREEAQSRGGAVAQRARSREDITISPNSGYGDQFPGTVFHAATPAPLTISAPTVRAPGQWQARDWSDSGCRLRGRAADLNDVIPGSLICIRENQDSPWTVSIVRRLRRLMVDHVEISLEFIGRKPRFIKLVTAGDPLPSFRDEPGGKRRTFGALYLPLSERRPTLPIKTLLVPVAAFEEGGVGTLVSSEARYTLRFNKALEHHADFVWTTFTLTARR